jgi:hypothetical protein
MKAHPLKVCFNSIEARHAKPECNLLMTFQLCNSRNKVIQEFERLNPANSLLGRESTEKDDYAFAAALGPWFAAWNASDAVSVYPRQHLW